MDAFAPWPEDAEFFEFEDIPTGEDVCVIGDSHLAAIHREWSRYLAEPDGTAPDHPNMFLDYRVCAVESVKESCCEINICINQNSRYHPAVRTLPRSQFVTGIRFRQYGKRDYLVVAQEWFDDIEAGRLSLYALVDAVDMRMLLERQGRITKEQLGTFRAGIDTLATAHPDHAFLAFADSVILKTNWSASYDDYDKSYRPEHFLAIANSVAHVFKTAFGLNAYVIATQGFNHLVEDPLMQVSENQNHVFFGSLATPFAELFDIDAAVRRAIRHQSHEPADLYVSHALFLTLNFKDSARRDQRMHGGEPFDSKTTAKDFSMYHVFNYADFVIELDNPRAR